MCKTEVSHTGLGKNFGSLKAEIFPGQKWSISYLWEHFLVLEHRIPIWVIFRTDNVLMDKTCREENHCNSLLKSTLLQMTRLWNSQNHYFYKVSRQRPLRATLHTSNGFSIFFQELLTFLKKHWFSIGFSRFLRPKTNQKPMDFDWFSIGCPFGTYPCRDSNPRELPL